MDKIEDALNLGRANEQAKRLLANHCLHADSTVNVSPLGREVGLPIGRAEIRCQYAPFFGTSAMDLTALAVEFYEQNCTTCVSEAKRIIADHRERSGASSP